MLINLLYPLEGVSGKFETPVSIVAQKDQLIIYSIKLLGILDQKGINAKYLRVATIEATN